MKKSKLSTIARVVELVALNFSMHDIIQETGVEVNWLKSVVESEFFKSLVKIKRAEKSKK